MKHDELMLHKYITLWSPQNTNCTSQNYNGQLHLWRDKYLSVISETSGINDYRKCMGWLTTKEESQEGYIKHAKNGKQQSDKNIHSSHTHARALLLLRHSLLSLEYKLLGLKNVFSFEYIYS